MMGRPALLVLLVSVIWSLSWPAVRFVAPYIPPITLVAGRMAIAALCLIVYLYVMGWGLPNSRRAWLILLPIAVFGNAFPYTVTAWAQHHVPSGLSAVLVGTMPVWTVLISHFFSQGERAGERLNVLKMFGSLSGFVGVILLVGPAALEGRHATLFGELALVVAAISWAAGTVYTSFIRTASPDQSAAATAAMATVLLAPMAGLWEQPWNIAPPFSALLAVLFLGVVATAIGVLLVFRITTAYGPTVVSMVMYLNPALAICWGALFFGEVLKPRHIAAFLFIAAGLWLIDRGRKRALQRARGLDLSPGVGGD